MRNIRPLLPLLLILLLAAVVRLVGINWALPSVYHVDEITLVRAAMGMRFGDLNPHFFDWPSLYKYLCFFLYTAFIKFRVPFQLLFGVDTMRQALPFWWGSTAPFHLLTRLMTMCFDLGSIALVFLIGKKLYNKHVGLLTALVMALSFTNSHAVQYSRVDVPTLFFAIVSFYFSILILEKGLLKYYLLAGLFAGFAASTKYNGALIVVPIITAYFLRILAARRRKTLRISSSTLRVGPARHRVRSKAKSGGEFGGLLLAGLAAVGGFFVGSPYFLFDFKNAWGSVNKQGSFIWQINSTGHGWNWLNFINRSMRADWGILMCLLFLGGLIWAIKKHRKKDILLLSFPIVYFAYAGSWGIVRSHYILLLYPFLALLAARFVFSFLLPKWGRTATAVLLGVCLIYPFSRIVENDISGLRGDTRNLAGDWILENISFETNIALDGSKPTSYLGGSLPILPRIEDGKGYFLHPFEKLVLKYGQDWEKMSLEFKEREVGFFVTSGFVHDRYEDQTFYILLDEKAILVQKFDPDWRTGPEINIYQLHD